MYKIIKLTFLTSLITSSAFAFQDAGHYSVTVTATTAVHAPETVKLLKESSTIGDKGVAWDTDASHFDNCAWDEGLIWMADYQEKAVEASITYRREGYSDAYKQEVFDNLGYVIHTSEDFYSHSNWVETHSIGTYAKLGVNSINKPSNWFSGTWKNDPSGRCAEGTPTHGTLSKDVTSAVGYKEAATDAVLEVQFQLREFQKALIEADGLENATEIFKKLGMFSEESKFSAALTYPTNSSIYFFKKNDLYTKFNFDKNTIVHTTYTSKYWEGLNSIASDVQASFIASNKKAYFFSKDKYIRYDIERDSADDGYPATISYGWKDIWNSDIDAVIAYPNSTKVYIFKGSEYVRFDFDKDEVDSGYPQPIAQSWSGLDSFAEGIDAATLSPNKDKVYFFKNNQYIRFDIENDKADEGYPKSISENWIGL